ncbi:Bctaz1 [Apiospora saccharicola]|uniref:Tafazzin family protein n=1 Tax=Apiospora saccharicola TaxID=335842 RepID=A0ABR1TL92_9PEZI
MTSSARNDPEASAASIAMRTPLEQPSLPWRMSSSIVLGATCMLSRGFLYGLNTVETKGLDRFLEILDKRKDVDKRERGLITVCNHVSVPLSTFFSLGQVLPTHRASHSPHGGAFQATISQAIRLLSAPPVSSRQPGPLDAASMSSGINDVADPFTAGDGLTYSTDGTDSIKAPSMYAQNRMAWVHIFPEGMIHQHPSMTMRYFKWGVARLILESEPMPDMLPMFIDGTQNIMSEARTFPGSCRAVARSSTKWRELVRQDQQRALGEKNSKSSWASISSLWSSKNQSTPTISSGDSSGELQQHDSTAIQHQRRGSQLAMGELSDELKYGAEAQALRIEVARRVRDEIEKLRVGRGYPEDDPKLGLAETWAKEPADARRFKSNADGSLVTKE